MKITSHGAKPKGASHAAGKTKKKTTTTSRKQRALHNITERYIATTCQHENLTIVNSQGAQSLHRLPKQHFASTTQDQNGVEQHGVNFNTDDSAAALLLKEVEDFKSLLPERHLLTRNTRRAAPPAPPQQAGDISQPPQQHPHGAATTNKHGDPHYHVDSTDSPLDQAKIAADGMTVPPPQYNSVNKAPTPTEAGPMLKSFDYKPLSEILQENKPLTRKQTRDLVELNTDTTVIEGLMKKVPKQFCLCRGCGIQFQYESEEQPGFIPAPNLQSYLLRMDIQLRAAKQDLRIRSGGGKGQGTAVAALHAALKSSLAHVQREADSRLGKVGRFKAEDLHKMGLDIHMRPLPRPLEYDPETGAPIVIEEPEDNPVLASVEHLRSQNDDLRKRIQDMMNDPKADFNEINRLQKQLTSEKKFYDLDAESKKIPKNEILNKRDVDMLTKAAKLAAKPAKCQRCHRLGSKQFGAVAQNISQSIPAEEFVKLLHNEFQTESAKSSIIIKLIDVLDFHGSMIQDLAKITGPRNPIILAINKCDVLPKHVSPQQVQQWAKAEVERYGLHVHSVYTISAHTGYGVDELINKALHLARGQNDPNAPKNRNIYVMGTTNAGKSTLVNQLLKKSIIGTGMPNDVTSLGKGKKPDDEFNNKNMKKKRGGGGDLDDAEDAALAEMIDTQPLDEEMEQDLIEAKKSERAAKKNAAAGGQKEDLATTLFSTKHDRDDPNVNQVIAGIDVAGIPKAALDAVMPSDYLLEHQKELQIQEASATTSPIPGTTLGIVAFPVLEKKRGGKNLQIKDTPGVLNSWQLTSHLNYAELKRVLPTKRMHPLTYRIQPGQSVFLGALARIDMISGRPFSVSSFVSSAMSVHIASSSRADKEYLESQIGINLIPPFDPEGENRTESLSILSNLANTSQEESDALRDLQIASRLENKEAMERSKQRLQNEKRAKGEWTPKRFDQSEQHNVPSDAEHFDDENVLANIPEHPRSGKDTLAHLRADVRQKMSQALGKLAPVSQNTSSIPSRTFIDEHGRLVVQLTGCGFKDASHDIVIAGLGWVSVTGSGPCTFRISVAGENAKLTTEELDKIANEMKKTRSEEDGDAVIQTQSNIDPLIHDKGVHSPRLPQRLKRLLSRVTIRDPLVAGQARFGDKWTGIPELVKKQFSPEMQETRNRLIRRNEAMKLWQKNPEIYPHPDEMDRGHFDVDVPEGYQTNDLVEMHAGKVLDGADLNTGIFDAVPHQPIAKHSREEMELFAEKLAYKQHEKQIMDDWEYIQSFHQKEALANARQTLDQDVVDELGSRFQKNQKQMDHLKQSLLEQRPTKEKLNQEEQQKKLKQLHKQQQKMMEASDDYDDDEEESSSENWSDMGMDDDGEDAVTETTGTEDDDDEELITDVNALLDMSSEEGQDVSEQQPKKKQQKEQKEQKQQKQQKQQHDDAFSSEDYSSEDGYQLTSDVEVITDINQMPTMEELQDMSDFDGVDYNDMRQRGVLDQYLAHQNSLINKQPVPTGKNGKKETGGRRAREAMGLISEDKFEEVKRIQQQKEAKALSNYLKKAQKAARYEDQRFAKDSKSSTKGKSNNEDSLRKPFSRDNRPPREGREDKQEDGDDDVRPREFTRKDDNDFGGRGGNKYGNRSGGDRRNGDRREGGGFRGGGDRRNGDRREGGGFRGGDRREGGGFRGGDREGGGFRGGDREGGGFRGGDRREGGKGGGRSERDGNKYGSQRGGSGTPRRPGMGGGGHGSFDGDNGDTGISFGRRRFSTLTTNTMLDSIQDKPSTLM